MTTSTHLHAEREPGIATDTEQDLSLTQVMGSALAAGFGVQSKDNKVRDFTHGRPAQFIIAGLTFTVGLLLALLGVVSMVV